VWFEAEWRQAFRNLEAILDDAGSGLGHVVKTTTFLTDLDNDDAANRLYAEHCPTNSPPCPRPWSFCLVGCSFPSKP